MKQFTSFADFYPFYLSEHGNLNCRRLHFVGSWLVIVVLLAAILAGRLDWLLWLPVVGYGPAWLGHFAFEKNRPATFRHPLYSLLGDWVMFKDIIVGRVALRDPR